MDKIIPIPAHLCAEKIRNSVGKHDIAEINDNLNYIFSYLEDEKTFPVSINLMPRIGCTMRVKTLEVIKQKFEDAGYIVHFENKNLNKTHLKLELPPVNKKQKISDAPPDYS